MPEAATFILPSRKRGWGCVTENLHTPLSPLFRGESKRLKFLIVKELITDVIEIEAKKEGTINEKTFYRWCLISFCVTVHV